MRCYITGEECTCGSFDVVGDCPHDEYAHEEYDDDFEDECIPFEERQFAKAW
jgi:hypothetical protein